jgi:hypothetical protein
MYTRKPGRESGLDPTACPLTPSRSSICPAGHSARARRKITELEEALESAKFLTPEHTALLAAMLDRIDRLNASIIR